MTANWITDRPPERFKRVLVKTKKESNPVIIGRFFGRDWYFESHKDRNGAEILVGKEHIIGWQELPE